jgi:hypothetical protein
MPRKMIWPYSAASPAVFPAPKRLTIGAVRSIKGKVRTAETIRVIRSA